MPKTDRHQELHSALWRMLLINWDRSLDTCIPQRSALECLRYHYGLGWRSNA